MNLKVSKEAARDLESIWYYSFDNWSLEQADRYLNLIFEEMEYLCSNPESGMNYSKVRKDYWRTKVKSHLIFYRINKQKKQIEIIRVLHEMMDIDHHL